jgi:hypothetical protein
MKILGRTLDGESHRRVARSFGISLMSPNLKGDHRFNLLADMDHLCGPQSFLFFWTSCNQCNQFAMTYVCNLSSLTA